MHYGRARVVTFPRGIDYSIRAPDLMNRRWVNRRWVEQNGDVSGRVVRYFGVVGAFRSDLASLSVHRPGVREFERDTDFGGLTYLGGSRLDTGIEGVDFWWLDLKLMYRDTGDWFHHGMAWLDKKKVALEAFG